MDIAYCCFTDTSNLGDYALFLANKRLFNAFNLKGGKSETVSSVNLFGGGTMYPHVLRFGWYPKRKVNVSIGIGVSDSAYERRFGFRTRWAMRRWPFLQYAVRGFESQRVLASYGIRSTVSGDTALDFEPSAEVPRSGELIGINIVGEAMRREGQARHVYQEMRSFCQRAQSAGFRIRLLPFCRKDVSSMERLCKELGSETEFVSFWTGSEAGHFGAFLNKVAECDLIVGERLHAVVIAAAMEVPFLSIGYKRKCYDFVGSVAAERCIVHPSELSSLEMWRRAHHLLEDGAHSDEIHQQVRNRRMSLRNTAREITDAIHRLVSRDGVA